MSKDLPFEGTQIDLGEDLLNQKTLTGETPALTQSSLEEVEDRLESARILLNEGITEEAKKVLRQVLVQDPHHVAARQKLQEIHDLELKQIFGDAEPTLYKKKSSPHPAFVDSDRIMRQLDLDLRLGVFTEGDADRVLSEELSLFKDKNAIKEFADKMDRDFRDLSPKDRMDLGIAFLEMNLYDLAVTNFRASARSADFVVAATSLLAYALICSGQPFEATLTIEPLLTDSDLATKERVELMYLMGRAHEGLRKLGEAIWWYQQVLELEPKYRDSEDRLKLIQERGRPA